MISSKRIVLQQYFPQIVYNKTLPVLRSSFVQSQERFSTKKTDKFKSKLSHSSQQWLRRQHKDPYVFEAKLQNFRARSAFKLIEIDDRFHIFQPGMTVLDLGAAPGSWTQVIVERVNALQQEARLPAGTVIAVDKEEIVPLEGATVVPNTDITKPAGVQRILQALQGKRAHVVVSDMAPNACGDRNTDHLRDHN